MLYGWARNLRKGAMLGLLALAGCSGAPEADWPVYGGDAAENHYSALDQISLDTIADLKPAWATELGVPRANSEPLEVNGVLYVAAGLSVVQAFDVETGEQLWRFEPDLQTDELQMRFAWGVRGLAYDDGLLFVGAQDGQLIAINAADGTQAWSVDTGEEPGDGRYITGAPRVFNGKVIIGHGGADFSPVRGYVTAYDQKTGRQAWRFYTVPGNPADGFEDEAQEMAARTWTGEWWKFGGGGTAWNAITFDEELNRIYVGTGNGAPWNPKIRSPQGGDNLFVASIVALDADSGRYLWHYQENPREAWDYNSTMDIELAEVELGGKARKVIMHAPKNGFFYLIDRDNGKLIAAEKLGKVTWASHIDLETGRPAENPGMRYMDGGSEVWPGNLGLHNWPPMAFSKDSGLVYIPAVESGMFIDDSGVDRENWAPVPGAVNHGVAGIYSEEVGPTASASLIAWDPVKMEKRWEVATPAPWNGGTLATAGGLVFQGQADGNFVAYNAATGERVWSYAMGTAALGTPITYTHKGVQYISLVSGPPVGSQFVLNGVSDYGWNYRTQPVRLVTFTLGGKGTIPVPDVSGPETPLVDAGLTLDPAMVSRGAFLWPNCMGCHGAGAISAGSAPDLRASPLHLESAAFAAVVRDGAMRKTGMPVFPELTDRDLAALRAYIQAEARKATE